MKSFISTHWALVAQGKSTKVEVMNRQNIIVRFVQNIPWQILKQGGLEIYLVFKTRFFNNSDHFREWDQGFRNKKRANLWICYIKNDWVALASLACWRSGFFLCARLKILNRRILILTSNTTSNQWIHCNCLCIVFWLSIWYSQASTNMIFVVREKSS